MKATGLALQHSAHVATFVGSHTKAAARHSYERTYSPQYRQAVKVAAGNRGHESYLLAKFSAANKTWRSRR